MAVLPIGLDRTARAASAARHRHGDRQRHDGGGAAAIARGSRGAGAAHPGNRQGQRTCLRAGHACPFEADLLVRAWTAIGAKVAEAGLRKLVIVNSHGGNVDIMSIVARELRVRHAIDGGVDANGAASACPTGSLTDRERVYGNPWRRRRDLADVAFPAPIWCARMRRGGLHLQRRSHEGRIPPHLPDRAARAGLDSPTTSNPHGVMGDASRATAEKGRIMAEHQAGGFVELLREVERYPLSNLYTG